MQKYVNAFIMLSLLIIYIINRKMTQIDPNIHLSLDSSIRLKIKCKTESNLHIPVLETELLFINDFTTNDKFNWLQIIVY